MNRREIKDDALSDLIEKAARDFLVFSTAGQLHRSIPSSLRIEFLSPDSVSHMEFAKDFVRMGLQKGIFTSRFWDELRSGNPRRSRDINALEESLRD